MPKEIVEIQLKRNAAKKEPWGLRIGGGVDRGKVLVLEKVFILLRTRGGHRDLENNKSTFFGPNREVS